MAGISQEPESEPLVSVIVPVYNVAPYLREGLDSLLHQTYRKLEILLIDDGSDDGSAEICGQYQRHDSRVRLIRQKNSGLSAARNAGLDAAHGTYTAFLDPDDAYAPDMIGTLLGALRRAHAQIAACDYEICCTEGRLSASVRRSRVRWKKGVFSSAEALRGLFSGDMGLAVWSKLFDSRLFADCRFTPGRNYEDGLIVPLLFERAGRIVSVGQPLVLHRKRSESITATASAKNMLDWFYARRSMERFLEARVPAVFNAAMRDRFLENSFRGIMKQAMRLLPCAAPENREACRRLAHALTVRSSAQNRFSLLTRAEYCLYRLSPCLCRAVRDAAEAARRCAGCCFRNRRHSGKT